MTQARRKENGKKNKIKEMESCHRPVGDDVSIICNVNSTIPPPTKHRLCLKKYLASKRRDETEKK